jgi:hypothetical protein
MNLREILSGMKIDRNKKVGYMSEEGREKKVNRIIEGRKIEYEKESNLYVSEVVKERRNKMNDGKKDIFGGENMGILEVNK